MILDQFDDELLLALLPLMKASRDNTKVLCTAIETSAKLAPLRDSTLHQAARQYVRQVDHYTDGAFTPEDPR